MAKKVKDMTEEERAERIAKKQDGMKTQGVKGAGLKKVNMTFSPANAVFLRTVARAGGLSQAKLVNIALDEYRAAHPDLMAKANALLEELTGENVGILPDDLEEMQEQEEPAADDEQEEGDA